jgi:hypothetical protein
VFLPVVEGERLFEDGGPVGNSADTAVRDLQASDRVQSQRTRGCAPSCNSCQQRAWLGAGLPAGIGRDSRLPSADGTASVSLRTLIRPALAEVNRLYLDSHPARGLVIRGAKNLEVSAAVDGFCATIGPETNSWKPLTEPSGELLQSGKFLEEE